MQSLYSLEQNPFIKAEAHEKNLLRSLKNAYRLLHYNLYEIIRIASYVVEDAERRAAKYLPTEEDKKASTRLYENPFIQKLENDETFQKIVESQKLASLSEKEVIKKHFQELYKTDQYQEYLSVKDPQDEDHKDILLFLYKKIMVKSELWNDHVDEIMPNWEDDSEAVSKQVLRTFYQLETEDEADIPTLPPEREVEFTKELFETTLDHNEELTALIGTKVKHWELDRLAIVDMILLKMALGELLYFPEIPVKVTINEYLEISKDYSTPKSKDFINGVLDNLMKELKKKGEIRKSGRGLID